jgi:hypothetical protein
MNPNSPRSPSRRISDEYWMARRLKLPLNWDGGVTDWPARAKVVREAIQAKGCALHTFNLDETWAQAFERVFQEPL